MDKVNKYINIYRLVLVVDKYDRNIQVGREIDMDKYIDRQIGRYIKIGR